MEYKCNSTACTEHFKSFRQVIQHRIEIHSPEIIQIQKLTINDKTSDYQWNLIKYNIVPDEGLIIIDDKQQKIQIKVNMITMISLMIVRIVNITNTSKRFF